DRLRRRGDLQHAPISAPQQFRPLAERVDVAQYGATVPKELLALRGQDEAAPDAVKQAEPQFALKLAELPRERGLSDAQAQRGFGNGAQLRYDGEGAQAPQVHRTNLCRIGMEYYNNYALDRAYPAFGHRVAALPGGDRRNSILVSKLA